MPLLDRQARGATLGTIRLGMKVTGRDGKERPTKLNTFRLTSPVRERIEAAAEMYGGTVEPWERRDGMSDQWQVVTDRDTLPVTMPNGDGAVEQDYQMFGGRPVVRQRLCDGFTERLRGTPCLCPSDLLVRAVESRRGNACKPITTVRLILADLPGLGVWMVSSTGDNAADELGRTAALLAEAGARGLYIPAALRLDQRRGVGSGEVHEYVVPVLDLGVSLSDIAQGRVPEGFHIESARTERLALTGGNVEQPPPAPEGPAFTDPQQLYRYALEVVDPRELWRLGKVAQDAGWLATMVEVSPDVFDDLGTWLSVRVDELRAP